MVSSSIIYTALFTMGFLIWINSINATTVHNQDDSNDSTSAKVLDNDQDDSSSSFEKRGLEHDNHFRDEYHGMMLGKRPYASKGVRLPAESILLGKRRLPAESILLGKRRLPAESILLGKRRLPAEPVLLGKRRLPAESILLGKRRLPAEAVLLGRRSLPSEDTPQNEQR
ncbi:unnamed protein product [Rotaria socialis]|uniref:Uncharacterized protein n=2 Tax=Rotaria socialis TaxID=392032 RepID=A0A817PYH4_9BILA|nr:unnamed protein product [Rotaria socialis]CAF3435032.1 unnamed protein product [Rotaria socialis]CAF3708414.1 unnamed protein product [Rotaria socialis]CAF3784216.1 unnamed protein product [Rotaria socialis]CAF4116536.1 unnamed protein product [Rotaria socialis]